MSKKTFKVEDFKDEINERLANYIESQTDPEYLIGLRTALEFVLHRTDNYCGFQYLDKTKVPYGERVGCHFEILSSDNRFKLENGKMIDLAFLDTDNNRVRYY